MAAGISAACSGRQSPIRFRHARLKPDGLAACAACRCALGSEECRVEADQSAGFHVACLFTDLEGAFQLGLCGGRATLLAKQVQHDGAAHLRHNELLVMVAEMQELFSRTPQHVWGVVMQQSALCRSQPVPLGSRRGAKWGKCCKSHTSKHGLATFMQASVTLRDHTSDGTGSMECAASTPNPALSSARPSGQPRIARRCCSYWLVRHPSIV